MLPHGWLSFVDAEGVNVALIEQLAPGASVRGQLLRFYDVDSGAERATA